MDVGGNTAKGRSGFFRTKSVEESLRDTQEPEHALKKSLSALDLTVFGVGVIIGTGIFVLTGKVAKENAGPAVALSFVAAGCRLRARRPVLRGVRLHRAGGRVRLHLLLRHPRRTARLDHRLGPGAGTGAGLRRGRGRMVGVRALDHGQLGLAPALGAVRRSAERLPLRPAGLPAGGGADRHPGRRDEALGPGHLRGGRHQADRGAHRDRRGRVLHQGPELHAVRPAYRAVRGRGGRRSRPR